MFIFAYMKYMSYLCAINKGMEDIWQRKGNTRLWGREVVFMYGMWRQVKKCIEVALMPIAVISSTN